METCQILRIDLWPWQTKVAAVGTSRRGGRWRYPVMVVVVPRQSGKTKLAAVACLDRCMWRPGSQVHYTAQSYMDARDRWRDIVRTLRRSRLVEGDTRSRDTGWDYRVRSAAGQEEVEWANGSSLRIFSPAEDSLHGAVTDLVVIDEARFFDAHQGDGLMAAVLPTQATRDGQVWVTSTAGGPDSSFLARLVESARAAVDDPAAHVGLAEWGLGGDPAPGDLLDAVWAAHPAAGQPGGPQRHALEVAYDRMPAWQFAHEYGNRWRTEADVRVLPAGAWGECRHPAPLGEGRPTFAADVPPDRSDGVIVAALDGVVELVDTLPAIEIPARLMALVERWDPPAVVVDGAGPAGTVAEALRPVCDRLVVASTRDLAAACAGFYDAVHAGTAQVRPNPVLDAAAAAASRRAVGQAWVWSRVDGGAPLVAASLALWAEGRAVAAAASAQDWSAF